MTRPRPAFGARLGRPRHLGGKRAHRRLHRVLRQVLRVSDQPHPGAARSARVLLEALARFRVIVWRVLRACTLRRLGGLIINEHLAQLARPCYRIR